jgi:hypothetical protein
VLYHESRRGHDRVNRDMIWAVELEAAKLGAAEIGDTMLSTAPVVLSEHWGMWDMWKGIFLGIRPARVSISAT